MAISYSVDKHAVAYPSAVSAQNYDGHILSFKIDDDLDNGYFCKVGDWVDYDLYDMADATEIVAEVVHKSTTSGMWIVLIRDPKDVFMIYQKPLIVEESPRKLTSISNFYNDPLDGAVRGYQLHKWDRVELSDECFSATPSVGKKITTIANGKLVIA